MTRDGMLFLPDNVVTRIIDLKKIPARGMLTRFHGSDWTEDYIHTVLFDL